MPHCEEDNSSDAKINEISAVLCPHLSNQSQTAACAEWHFVRAQCVLLTKRASHQQRVGCCKRQTIMSGDKPAKFLPPLQKRFKKPKQSNAPQISQSEITWQSYTKGHNRWYTVTHHDFNNYVEVIFASSGQFMSKQKLQSISVFFLLKNF